MKRGAAWTIGLGLVAMLVAPLVPVGCTGQTGGERFSFEARAGGTARTGADGAPLTFTNERDWTITLTKADVTIGPLYLNVVPPLSDQTQTLLRAPWSDVFIKSAWAAGEGHLGDGRVVGEVLAQLRFSALSTELVPFPALGSITQDEVRTADVWLYPSSKGSATTNLEATKTDTVSFDVIGEASKGGEIVRFRGALLLDDAWQPAVAEGSRSTVTISSIRKVRGIPAGFFPTPGGHLDLRFDVTRLFRGADFSNLADNPTDKDGVKQLVQSKTGKVTTDQVMTNLYQGMHESTGTYSVRWASP